MATSCSSSFFKHQHPPLASTTPVFPLLPPSLSKSLPRPLSHIPILLHLHTSPSSYSRSPFLSPPGHHFLRLVFPSLWPSFKPYFLDRHRPIPSRPPPTRVPPFENDFRPPKRLKEGRRPLTSSDIVSVVFALHQHEKSMKRCARTTKLCVSKP